MRPLLAGLFLLLLVWAGYVASPYYALYRMGQAVERGDADAVAARLNTRAVRYSIARQIAAALVASEPASGIASAEAQVAASAAMALANPLMDDLVRPEGLLRLLRRPIREDGTGTAFGRASIGIEDLDDFLSASHWRGFRTVYVRLPPHEPGDQRFRLQLRLGNWRWRVVSIELPSQVIRRISSDLKGRTGR